MPVQKSLTAYQQEKLNCAQSILRGFQNIKKVSMTQSYLPKPSAADVHPKDVAVLYMRQWK
jgi:hypothetical protein